jgi:hypothetical protein
MDVCLILAPSPHIYRLERVRGAPRLLGASHGVLPPVLARTDLLELRTEESEVIWALYRYKRGRSGRSRGRTGGGPRASQRGPREPRHHLDPGLGMDSDVWESELSVFVSAKNVNMEIRIRIRF